MTDAWRDPGVIAEALKTHGSQKAAARALGVPESTFRRQVHAFEDGGGALSASSKKVTFMPQEAVSREEILTKQLKEAQTALRQIREGQVAEAQLLEMLQETVVAREPAYEPAPRTESKADTPHRFGLLWSDLHAAEMVSSEETNGLNAYDWSIMLRRHDQLRKSILSFRDNRPYPVEALHLFALGDMVTGDIHDELRVTNERVLLDTVVQLAYDMGAWIESFVPEFPEIIIDGISGNHGRTTKKPQAKQGWNNYDWLFYRVLEVYLARYESITIRAPKSLQTPVSVFDHRVLLLHGDGIPSNHPGIPWGGVTRRVSELAKTYQAMGQPVDYYFLGHFHDANLLGAGKVIVNASVKGPDEYSLKKYGGGSPAMQVLTTFHPRRGLTDLSFLDLQEVV